jgi:hypothetical protein
MPTGTYGIGVIPVVCVNVPLNNAGIMKLAKFTDSEARGRPISSCFNGLAVASATVRCRSSEEDPCISVRAACITHSK